MNIHKRNATTSQPACKLGKLVLGEATVLWQVWYMALLQQQPTNIDALTKQRSVNPGMEKKNHITLFFPYLLLVLI